MGEQNNSGAVYIFWDGEKNALFEISGEIAMSVPRLNRMSRKRFIKLCMASGASRNHARDTALYLVNLRRNDELQNELNKLFGCFERRKELSYALAAWYLNLNRRGEA